MITQAICTNLGILQHFGKKNYEKNEDAYALTTTQFPPLI